MEFQGNDITGEEKIFSVPELLHYIFKKSHIMIAVALLFAVGGYLFSILTYSPTYTAVTSIYVVTSVPVDPTDSQSATFAINDCKVLITSRNIISAVIDELDLDTNVSTLTKCVSVSSSSNSRVFQINVNYHDDELAAAIANKIREIASVQIKSVVSVEDVRTVYEADSADEEQSESYGVVSAVVCALAGALITAGVLILICFFDSSIRTEKDVKNALNTRVLCAIPDSDAFGIKSTADKN